MVDIPLCFSYDITLFPSSSSSNDVGSSSTFNFHLYSITISSATVYLSMGLSASPHSRIRFRPISIDVFLLFHFEWKGIYDIFLA